MYIANGLYFLTSRSHSMKLVQKFLMTALTLMTFSALANTPKETIAAMEARLVKIGEPRTEGTEKAGEKTAPGMFFGARKINNNYDVVDEIKKSTGATATVFVKSGDEFVRVSTNVLTPEGKRGVGTPLARAKAYDALSKGEQYCGQVDVLGTAFEACYNPVKDKAGKIIGAIYVGYKK
jgi:sensor histidine kinase regulating citrate/malate metabolism